MDSSKTASASKAGMVFTILIVAALIGLVVYLDMRRREAEQKIAEMSMQYQQQAQNPSQNQEEAKAILDKVRQLYEIPDNVEPTVATIVDVDQLRARNSFYDKAQNGDHLIVTNDRAILYDPVANKIIDVVPVQIQTAPSPRVAPAAHSASSVLKGSSSSTSTK